jgi:hypothetical protein
VEPLAEMTAGERVIYDMKELKKGLSCKVIAVKPKLVLQAVSSRSLPANVSGKVINDVDTSKITRAKGWISLKSSGGQLCVSRVMLS